LSNVGDFRSGVWPAAAGRLGRELACFQLVGACHDRKNSERSGSADGRCAAVGPGQVENAWIISRTRQGCGRTDERLRKSPASGLHAAARRDGAEIVNGEEIAGIHRFVDGNIGGIIPGKAGTGAPDPSNTNPTINAFLITFVTFAGILSGTGRYCQSYFEPTLDCLDRPQSLPILGR